MPPTASNQQSAGIYIHIPFCRKACNYCNFHFSTTLGLKDKVIAGILKELEIQKDYLQGAEINTLYFGGGTPSLLSPDVINRIFDQVEKHYQVNNIVEFTLEANPDDLTIPYLKALKATPVNRFSIGVQSFRDNDLQYMNRAHNAQQADSSIKAAQDIGFTNLSIDLIYGTPGLDDKSWKDNLGMVKQLEIPHFSAYTLTVEEGTALHHSIKTKKTTPLDQEQAAGQFELLMEQAAIMGYEQYEISNLAIQGHQAIHNTNYWKGNPYLGIGPSAHSFNGSSRRWNIANNALYVTSILQEGKLQYEEEQLTPVQHLNEYIMTSLRTMWGCDLDKIAHEWHNDYATLVEKSSHWFQEKKWVTQEGKKLILTGQGKLFADKIAAEMFVEEHQ